MEALMSNQPENRAGMISLQELPDALRKAIVLAGDNYGAQGPLIAKWQVAGRMIQDPAKATAFSNAVVKHLEQAGINANPAVLTIRGETLAGFVQLPSAPEAREL
jgi:hypothetical protein